MKKIIISLFSIMILFAAVFFVSGDGSYAASSKIPQAKITHFYVSDWFDYEDFCKVEGYEPEHEYYNDGEYYDYEGYYIKKATIQARKEKGNYKYQFAFRKGSKGKWEKLSYGKARSVFIYDIARNKTIYAKVRCYKETNGKKKYGEWSPVVKTSTHDKEVHVKNIYAKNKYVKGYLRGAIKGEKIVVKVGKKTYSATVNKTSKKYPFKIYIGNHKPGITVKTYLRTATKDTVFTSSDTLYYAYKIKKGFTKKQVKWTKTWGSPSDTASAANGWSYWYYDDGSEIDFKNGKVYWWYDAAS